MKLELEKKVVLICGSSKGIGFEIANKFATEGARIILTGRNKNNLSKSYKYLISKYNKSYIESKVTDFTDTRSIEGLKKMIIKKYKKLDIVIANVGSGISTNDPIPDSKQWEKIWNINFNSAINTARAFVSLLEKSGGNILFISSITGIEFIKGAPTDYSTSKSALIYFAKNIARKLSPKIRVNVIAPGNILFPNGSWDKKLKKNPQKIKKLIKETVPMQKFGRPDDIANAALFLCSEKASFITAETIVIDGGQTSS